MPPEYRRGRRLRHEDLNAILDGSGRATRTSGSVRLDDGPGGRLIHPSGPRAFWAKITGPAASGRYPFHEVCGATLEQCGPDQADALEVAGLTVDVGTIVRMYSTAFDHRFARPCRTCTPCPGPTSIGFAIYSGCLTGGQLGPGIEVFLDRVAPDPDPQAGLDSAFTDANGYVNFNLNRTGFGPGYYQARVPAFSPRFAASSSGPYRVNCGQALGASPSGLIFRLAVPSDHVCFWNCSQWPWRKSPLYLTNKWGTFPVYRTDPTRHFYSGTQTIYTNATTTHVCDWPPPSWGTGDRESQMPGQPVTLYWESNELGGTLNFAARSMKPATTWPNPDGSWNAAFGSDESVCRAGCEDHPDCYPGSPAAGGGGITVYDCENFFATGTAQFVAYTPPAPNPMPVLIDTTPIMLSE